MSGLPQPRPPRDRAELDEVTLRRAQRGDPDACQAFVRRYEGLVFDVVGRMLRPRGLAGLVEDIAQESFLRAFRALPDFDRAGAARLSTWLACIASRLAINELARKRPTESTAAAVPGDGPECEIWRLQLRRGLQAAIVDLTPEQQAVFVMREFEGLAEKEIAAALGVEPGTVKSRLSRARARLRLALKEIRGDV